MKTGSKAKKPHAFHLRWMIRRDMEDIHRIEREEFPIPWTEDEFVKCLRQRNCIGMVAENADDKVVGYMIYELHRSTLIVLNFAVCGWHQRLGVGRTMVEKLKGKLSAQRRCRIEVDVWERNLDAQLFWRAMGFQFVKAVPIDSTTEYPGIAAGDDAYVFRYDFE